MSKKTLLEVRIGTLEKVAARRRAREQGLTLSRAVRMLLRLWVEGQVDLAALDELPRFPKAEDLEDLGRTVEALHEALGEATARLEALRWWWGK